ncbi:unnamed protein product [Schistosoma mattheei]|uniref:Uncharacterized protein n=1 Tax=Schistosoma mattheei TaxID=31246 RepID=A0A183Q7G6_9TREM|nr:unnamed protein product [Schistosoma mattheei]
MFFSRKYVVLVLPIRTSTSASDPPCSSMMLPEYVKITDKLFKESAYINRSLAFLEQTILALSDPARDYIPYRQSKLTHFLKNSIGGRCQTILIANIWNKNTFLKETVRFR